MKTERITIFTDGASRGNPGPGGWGAIIVIPNEDNRNLNIKKFKVAELGGREEHTTNNRMELTAALEALSFLSSYKLKAISCKLVIYSDSSYVVSGITKWVYSWERRNWLTATKKPVLNKDLWEKLLGLVRGRGVEWKVVGGHVGVAGNERADEIATVHASGLSPKLYDGPLDGYPIKKIIDVSVARGRDEEKKSSKARARAKAYSYVSLVHGVVEKHKTWSECESRIKGQSGARFKKAVSVEEEARLVREWSKQS